MLLDEVVERFVEEGRDDHVGLWQLVRAVREDLGLRDPVEVRAATLDLVRVLLAEHGIEAGFPAPDGRGFLPWSSRPDETIDRIARGWDALGRDPNIGEIVWFNTP
jgi:hypothetical protein